MAQFSPRDGDAFFVTTWRLAARIGPIWARDPDDVMRSCRLVMMEVGRHNSGRLSVRLGRDHG